MAGRALDFHYFSIFSGLLKNGYTVYLSRKMLVSIRAIMINHDKPSNRVAQHFSKPYLTPQTQRWAQAQLLVIWPPWYPPSRARGGSWLLGEGHGWALGFATRAAPGMGMRVNPPGWEFLVTFRHLKTRV